MEWLLIEIISLKYLIKPIKTLFRFKISWILDYIHIYKCNLMDNML